jgi:hypothetical protein
VGTRRPGHRPSDSIGNHRIEPRVCAVPNDHSISVVQPEGAWTPLLSTPLCCHETIDGTRS